jgi:ABC-2 type transport system permease protein
MMVLTIARKEFTEMIRDGRFRWMSAIVLLLLLTSLALGWKHYLQAQAEHGAAQAASRDTWINQGRRNPHSAAHYGVYAFKPKMPLSLVDTGLDPYTGVSVWLEAHYQNPSRYRPAEDATAVRRFGELTAAMTLQMLAPLLIILLAFSAFAGEREQGTLRQLLSLGAPRFKLVSGKVLGLTFALALLLAPATLAGVLALALASEDGAMMSNFPRLALLCAGYLLYLGEFIGVSLACSALASSARAALVALLAFWIVNGLLVPRLATDVAERLYPTPTAEEFWQAVHKDQQQGVDGHDAANSRTEELKRRTMAEYKVERLEDLPINFSGVALQAGEEYGNRVFDKHYGEVWKIYYRQERVHKLGALVAPLMAVRGFSMGLAGVDLRHHQHFTDAAESYRRSLNRLLNEDFARNSRTSDEYNYFVGHDFWRKTPDFVYAAPDADWVMKGQVFNLAALIVWLVVAFAASFFAANRMRGY